ncbi:hypothetical protein T439DRAFT_377611, partial [Meredithblackwellia eburnea MCA 4105]
MSGRVHNYEADLNKAFAKLALTGGTTTDSITRTNNELVIEVQAFLRGGTQEWANIEEFCKARWEMVEQAQAEKWLSNDRVEYYAARHCSVPGCHKRGVSYVKMDNWGGPAEVKQLGGCFEHALVVQAFQLISGKFNRLIVVDGSNPWRSSIHDWYNFWEWCDHREVNRKGQGGVSYRSYFPLVVKEKYCSDCTTDEKFHFL